VTPESFEPSPQSINQRLVSSVIKRESITLRKGQCFDNQLKNLTGHGLRQRKLSSKEDPEQLSSAMNTSSLLRKCQELFIKVKESDRYTKQSEHESSASIVNLESNTSHTLSAKK
jgi:hypothetical protein